MNFLAKTEDHLIGPQGGAPRGWRKDFLVSVAASLAINATFLALMIWEIAAHDETPNMQETPVELIVEAPFPPPESVVADAPRPELRSPSDLSAKSDAKPKGGGIAQVGDANRSLKAPLGSETISGEGQTEARDSAPPQAERPGDAEPVPPDRDKEISHLVPPAATPRGPTKQKIPQPGPARKATRQKPDEKAEDHETTVKPDEIHCGANAKVPTSSELRVQIATVLGGRSAEEALQVHANMQAARDLVVGPRFLHYEAILIRFDGDPYWRQFTTFLPPGMSVTAGDRVEVGRAFLDRRTPCHYIPSQVRRVL